MSSLACCSQWGGQKNCNNSKKNDGSGESPIETVLDEDSADESQVFIGAFDDEVEGIFSMDWVFDIGMSVDDSCIWMVQLKSHSLTLSELMSQEQ